MKKSKSQQLRKLFLIAALAFNIGIFIYFKYTNFMITNINFIFKTNLFFEKILLPLGISFFTFQQVSYIIDYYKGEVPDYDILDYAVYVTFFPQLIAGPIVYHNEFIPQFHDKENKKLNWDNMTKGLSAFGMGLFKKVIIADFFAVIVNSGYTDIGALDLVSAVFTILAYTLQIYFDFSGYCDMAIGIGYMFNIKIPQNFNSPYKALGIVDFWKRWHMTLTRFFKKYLYIPLGGNRKGEFRTNLNIFIVFLVSGLWHGSNWTFIIWGALHGAFTIIEKIIPAKIKKVPNYIKWALTFSIVNITWVFFRADSLGDAVNVIKQLFNLNIKTYNYAMFTNMVALNTSKLMDLLIYDYNIPLYFVIFAALIGAIALVLFTKNTYEIVETKKANFKNSIIIAAMLVIAFLQLSKENIFLYFNF